MKIASLLICLIACINGIHAQVFTIKDGSVNTGSGMFYDSGGKDGKYSGGENFVLTVNAGSENRNLVMNFTKFTLAEGDWLSVYDGNSTDAAQIDIFSNKNPLNGDLKASNSALTFVFHSESGNLGDGWEAYILSDTKSSQHTLLKGHSEGGVLLIYSLRGLKNENDAEFLNSQLMKLDYVHNSEVHFLDENIFVTVSSEEYTFKIKDFILSLESELGYKISIDFLRSENRAHNDSN